MNPTTSWNDTQKLLAFLIVGALVLVIFVMMFFPPKGDQAAIAVFTTLVGALVANAGGIVQFYFGNSRSATAKDATIATALAQQSPNPPSAGPVSVTAQTTASG